MNLNLSLGTGGNPPKKVNNSPGQLTWDVLHRFILSRGLGENIRKQLIKDIRNTPATAYPYVINNFNKYVLRAQELVIKSEQIETERMEASDSTKEEFTFGKKEEVAPEETDSRVPDNTRSEDGTTSTG